MKTMSKKREVFDAIVEVCENLDLDYRDYSGRCMYGEKCIGFVSEHYLNDLVDFGMEMNEVYPDFNEDTRCDNMGRDAMIVYFPYVSWPDDVEMEQEEED